MRTTKGDVAGKRAAGIRDAKARLSEILHDVQRGREWVITQRGKPIARLVPITGKREPLAERLRHLEQLGIIERPAERVLPLPPPLPVEPGFARKMLDQDRRA
jgi:prevent-host-death family protein